MNTLVVLLGPTGVGKTALSLLIAQQFKAPIISADSRQFYKELTIGTAAPTQEELSLVKHYMVGNMSLANYYSASQFESDVLLLLESLFKNQPIALLSGGSMMYIDAICKGIDEMPTVTPEIRTSIWNEYEENGLTSILNELKSVDLKHYNEVDRYNYKRVIHAVEICRMTGKPYSSFRTNSIKKRPFKLVKIGLTRPREELYERINSRVDKMIVDGLLEEAREVYPYRSLNALNTVGYKEMFQYLDGAWTLDFAIDKIKQNSRIYARKQMTWFKRDKEIKWFHPNEQSSIIEYIKNTRDDSAF